MLRRSKIKLSPGRWGSPVAVLRRTKIKLSPGQLYLGAGEGNRTLVVSLEGFCSTIELHPQHLARAHFYRCAAEPFYKAIYDAWQNLLPDCHNNASMVNVNAIHIRELLRRPRRRNVER